MPELILAIDAGTTSARVAIVTPQGEIAALARAPLMTSSPSPGRMEQDAVALWRTVRRLIAKALSLAGRAAPDIAAVGVTTQRTSALLWDRAGVRPLTPIILWSDLRGASRAAELASAGHLVAPQQAAAKLEALVGQVEDGAALIAAGRLAFGGVDSFLIARLTGGAAHVTDRSQAWPTGYLDLASLDWNGRLIAGQRLDPALFPRLVDTHGEIARTDPAHFGAAVPIACDIADQQAALVAHGEGVGVLKVTFGTAAAADIATGPSLVFKTMAMPPFIVSSVQGETRFCVEAMVISAGSALDWLGRTGRLGPPAALQRLAAQADDAGGVAFLPALSGLGAPAPDLAATGRLAGLTPSATRANLARAGLEGVAFRVREAVLALIEAADVPTREAVNVDGGLCAGETFLQIQADLLARPLRRHAVREATALGAALLAGRGVGLLTPADAAAFTRYDRTFEPRLSTDEAAARHLAWRRTLWP